MPISMSGVKLFVLRDSWTTTKDAPADVTGGGSKMNHDPRIRSPFSVFFGSPHHYCGCVRLRRSRHTSGSDFIGWQDSPSLSASRMILGQGWPVELHHPAFADNSASYRNRTIFLFMCQEVNARTDPVKDALNITDCGIANCPGDRLYYCCEPSADTCVRSKSCPFWWSRSTPGESRSAFLPDNTFTSRHLQLL